MPEFIAKRVFQQTSIHLMADPKNVFPLFSAVGEREWVEGWNPELIYPQSGEVEIDAIFLTQHETEKPVVWVTVDYKPEEFEVRYLRVLVNDHVADIRIQCTKTEYQTTLASISYTFTGLSTSGNDSISIFTEEYFQQWIGQWETNLNNYLCLGTSFKKTHPIA
jgi:hypothetical protein